MSNEYIKLVDFCNKKISINENKEIETKEKKNNDITVWWQLEKQLIDEKKLFPSSQALSFFCPVYFAGQLMVRTLLDQKDEHGELVVFSLPSISDPERIKVGIKQMDRLGIKNPEQYLTKNKKNKKVLRTYSMLPGVEGIGSGEDYPWIVYEAVQLGAFQIVPKEWLNEGDPYNESYKFPGEKGYSPYWRVPGPEEFKKMRPDLFKLFKQDKNGNWLRNNKK